MKRINRKSSALFTIRLSAGTVMVGFLVASKALAADPYEAKTYPHRAAKTLIVDTDSGPIVLRRAQNPQISVDVVPAVPGDDCRVSQELKGDALHLSAHGARKSLGRAASCSAGFTVVGDFDAVDARSGSGDVDLGIPCRTASVKTGSGAISFHGISAILTLRSGSGAISGDSSGPKIDAATGSGGVNLYGLTGPVTVKTGNGAVSLTWTKAPKTGSIDVRTGSADLTASLPASAALKTSFKSGSGTLRSDFDDDAKASLELTFRSGSGSATLKKAL